MARKKPSRGMRSKVQRGFAVLALLLLVAAIAVVAVLDRRVTQQFEGRRWTLPARVYAQPVDLYAGQQLSAQRFADELERLGYLATPKADRPGTYRRRGDEVSVYVREFRFADGPQPARSLRVGFAGDAIAGIADDRGVEVPVFRLDPLLIGSIFPMHGEDRIVVAPDEVPPLLPEALKAVEDRAFETHHGVNPLAILRALFVNVRAGQVEQGGSTLTQQLVKSYFLDNRRTLRRKAEEAVMAVILESRFEKADIMNAYINEIWLGQDGNRAVHGFGLASQFYFGKPLAELNLSEIALLVAIARGPSYYNPRRHPERALERRNLVLRVLAEQGVVSPEDAERATRRPLGVADAGTKGGSFYPAFLDLVRRQLRQDYDESSPGSSSASTARAARVPRDSRAWSWSRRRRRARWQPSSADGTPPTRASTGRSTRSARSVRSPSRSSTSRRSRPAATRPSRSSRTSRSTSSCRTATAGNRRISTSSCAARSRWCGH